MPTIDPGLFAGPSIFFFFIVLPTIILSIALTIFWIVELIDVARREFPDPSTKVLWILVILLTNALGAIIYYFVGKSQGTLPGETRHPPGAGY